MGSGDPQGALAIVGLECRLPGADGLDEYWKLVRNAGSALGPLPEGRLNRQLYFDPKKSVIGRSYSEMGGIVSDRPVDYSALGLSQELIENSDIAHLILCEVAAKACRDAGYDPHRLPNRQVGVYIGHTGGSPWVSDLVYGNIVAEGAQHLLSIPAFQELRNSPQVVKQIVDRVRATYAHQKPGANLDLGALAASSLISKAFGLTGPYMVVDAACASSLQAMAVGIRALRQGRIDMAIVGGASYCKSDSLVLFSAAQSVSNRGSCPFGAGADGLVSAEGYVILVLKTLERAVADGDRIRAVIQGVGVSSDGKGKSLWAPRKEGQQLAVKRAYGNNLDPRRLQYIEAHATSTQVGDATELQALSESLAALLPTGSPKIPVGSAKGNVGHTLETAGMAGLVKTVLAMEHGIIPPAVGNGQLNEDIDWPNSPFYVPFKEQPWPEFADGHSRRAAVNAFGIGGLNIHLVLDQRAPAMEKKSVSVAIPSQANAQANDDRAIAIVGAGCILPGAKTLAAFWDLISSGRDPKIPAPKSRWNAELYLSSDENQDWSTHNTLGGYVQDYVYDWKKHKVPPKQVANANPLQFMLLDAADQALRDAGYDQKPFDTTRTAVVVGTIFGGDFSHHLQMGLRLPEFRLTLAEVLRERGVSPAQIDTIAQQFEKVVLERMPALLDETGSFTSSTLASRITKTFNLMGGAMALDAGDCSSLFALQSGVDILLEGSSDMVVCAAGQCSMDAWTFRLAKLAGVLSHGNPKAAFDTDADGQVPGEGCGVFLLKRLSDARRDGDTIKAVIRGIGASRSTETITAVQNAMQRALDDAQLPSEALSAIEAFGMGVSKVDSQELAAIESVLGARSEPIALGSLSNQIGNTGGASGLASLLKASMGLQHGTLPPTVNLQSPVAALKNSPSRLQAANAALPIATIGSQGYRAAGVTSISDDMAYHVIIDNGQPVPTFKTSAAPANEVAVPKPPTTGENPWRVLRLAAHDRAGLTRATEAALANVAAFWASGSATTFAPTDRERLAIVADSPETLKKRLLLAKEAVAAEQRNSSWEEQGVFLATHTPTRRRAAALFPGQGSQYAGMLQELASVSPVTRDAVGEASAVMKRHGWETFEQLAWSKSQSLGSDIWHTQASMLLANFIAYRTVQSLGLRPDIISAHSFGEFPALVAAGAWTLDEAAQATRSRCEALLSSKAAKGAMLSVLANKPQVQQLLAERPDEVWLCAENGPDQHVVGGNAAAVERFANRCGQLRIKTKLLAVPCPFHTPLLRDTQAPLAAALAKRTLLPPSMPLLSSTSARFISDPHELRSSLVQQMTDPVQFVTLVQRLYDLGTRVFVEVGPAQVLTQLSRRTLADKTDVHLLSLDHASRSGAEQVVRMQAFLETLDLIQPPSSSAASVVAQASAQPVSKPAVKYFDATERRRLRMRAEATSSPQAKSIAKVTPAVEQPSHHAISNGNGSNGHYKNGSGQNGHATPVQPVVPPTPVVETLSAADEKCLNIVLRIVREQVPADKSKIVAESAWRERTRDANAVLNDLAEFFDLSSADAQSLARCRTVGELAIALRGKQGKAEWVKPTPAAAPVAAPDLQRFLVQFVVEQTGYPEEIVELDADLESDLGIDSIKKAQLFGEIGEQFDLQPDENLSLDDFPTLRHVLAYLRNQPGLSSSQSTPSAAPPMVPVATAPQPQAATTTVAVLDAPAMESSTDLQAFLVNFVVEQTGYPAEIVELDADLESDLGIDSIKKAQLFGEIGEQFSLQADENLSLDDFPTLRHVLRYLQAQPNVCATSAVESPATITIEQVSIVAPPVAAPTTASTPSVDLDLHAFLVNFVVEQTGYPAEIVELDADLESDLGIDSIKKAQLFGEIGEQFNLQADDNLSLDDFPTLRHVLSYLQRTLPGNAVSTPTVAEVAQQAPTEHNPAFANGLQRGRAEAAAIRHLLRLRSANFRVSDAGKLPELTLTASERAELQGLAQGAGVLEENLLALNAAWARDASPTNSFMLSTGHALGVSVAASHDVPLVMELRQLPSRLPCLVIALPGQVGALAGYNASGLVASVSQGAAASLVLLRLLETCGDLAAAQALLASVPAAKSLGLRVSLRGEVAGGGLLSWPEATDPREALSAVDELQRQAAIRDSAATTNKVESHWLSLLATADELQLLRGCGNYLTAPEQPRTQPAPMAVPLSNLPLATATPHLEPLTGPEITQRFVLRMVEHPRSLQNKVALPGLIAIVGEHHEASALRDELTRQGHSVALFTPADDLTTTLAEWDKTLEAQLPRVLVLLTAREEALPVGADSTLWQRRRQRGMLAPYFIAQHWLTRLAEKKLVDQSQLMAVTALGGDFGLAGDFASAEGGALSGLLKGLRLEYATLNVRIVDVATELPAAQRVREVSQELTTADSEGEVGLSATGKRYTVRPALQPIDTLPLTTVPQRGGAWVVTGGARGVTAVIARELGDRFGVKLHLLGATALGGIDPQWLTWNEEQLKTLRGQTMIAARQRGEDPANAWKQIEKSLEIERNLQAMRDAGLHVTYHVCDVADRAALSQTLAKVRAAAGPIQGIIHGAGFEAAARFDRKKLAGVDRTLAAKNDGAAALIALTQQDPVRYFVGFGSTSGRLGGIGQTDYCMANDFLAKQLSQLRAARPDCRCAVFHWHAWDEVGMAARPESRFALEAFGLQFMPLREGVRHLIGELLAGLPEPEVLITEARLCPLTIAPSAGVAIERAASIELPSAAMTPAVDWDAFLVNFVVEQTGYPPEIVELDADLESDLGIDSIKKA
ncbi:MAG TPA: beta-ketoacyl synthase N-terminal-like domain-containing protein, partial [Pirellulaceae bacterium]|nr:beta-ketoacyl synthase N-terminal-like domain-containing protein [Pirellulaceae bacterium]